MPDFPSFLAGILLSAALFAFLILRRATRTSNPRSPSFHTSIEQIRAIGQLSVFKVITKEIVTEVDHSWGEFGKRYLSWILSNRKMAMIFEFEIDFRYDLRSPKFRITPSGDSFLLQMPPCRHSTHIRDIHFYDEQKSKLIPWLLPDLVNTVFGGGFSEEDRNRLKDEALKRAASLAQSMVANLSSEVEQSAKQTLQSLARAFGAENVSFEFLSAADSSPEITLRKS